MQSSITIITSGDYAIITLNPWSFKAHLQQAGSCDIFEANLWMRSEASALCAAAPWVLLLMSSDTSP